MSVADEMLQEEVMDARFGLIARSRLGPINFGVETPKELSSRVREAGIG